MHNDLFFRGCYIMIHLAALLLAAAPQRTSAQTQRGVVRTLGRPEQRGVALAGVSIRARGSHNAVLSRADGSFELALPGMSSGEAYALQQVRKSGYELNEAGIIGRQMAFSERVALTLVMVSSAQLQADKQRIEAAAYRVAERNFQARMEELRRQSEAGALAAEDYNRRLQDLQQKFEHYQDLIDELAEHYAHTDYDLLEPADRQINLCIERGELERADSLIRTLFDPIGVLRRNQAALQRIEQSEEQARRLLAEAEADLAAVLRQQQKDAEYLYQLQTIALGRYDFEQAAKYLETRAGLDTANVEWQMQAGGLLRNMAAYDRALDYYGRAMRLLDGRGEGRSAQAQACQSNIGCIYLEKGDCERARAALERSLELSVEETQDSLDVAFACNNLGELHRRMGADVRAMSYLARGVNSLTAYLRSAGDSTAAVAPRVMKLYFTLGINLAELTARTGGIERSASMLSELMASSVVTGYADSTALAQISNNIGQLYAQKGDGDNALNYLQQSLDFFRRQYGEMHPGIAVAESNIGEVYRNRGQLNEAMEHQQRALDIYRAVYGERHHDVARCLNNIGLVWNDRHEYERALDCFRQAADIIAALHPQGHLLEATVENNAGLAYFHRQEFPQAKEHYGRALALLESLPGLPDYALLTATAGSLHMVCDSLGLQQASVAYWLKKLRYYEQMTQHMDKYRTNYYRKDLALEYQQLAERYRRLGMEQSEDSCYATARRMLAQLPKREYKGYAAGFLTQALMQMNLQQADEGIANAKYSLNICLVAEGERSLDVATCYEMLATLYMGNQDCPLAVDYSERALELLENDYPGQHEKIHQCYAIKSSCLLTMVTSRKDTTATDTLVRRTEESFGKLLAIIEQHYPDDEEKKKQAAQGMALLYINQLPRNQRVYEEKLLALATKYPKQVRPVLLRLQEVIRQKQQ